MEDVVERMATRVVLRIRAAKGRMVMDIRGSVQTPRRTVVAVKVVGEARGAIIGTVATQGIG